MWTGNPFALIIQAALFHDFAIVQHLIKFDSLLKEPLHEKGEKNPLS